MIKLRVVYIPYERYCGDLSVRIGHIKAPTLKSALLEMLDWVSTYMDEESIAQEEAEYGNEITADEIIRRIRQHNGDGCDTIVSILEYKANNQLVEYMADDESELKLREWYVE